MQSGLLKVFRTVLFLAGCSLLLSACGGGYKTQVIDSTETRHLKGHQKPYTVNGQRYDPLSSPAGFIEEGLASWYGRDFHGKKTSNGEIYDMHAMTGAHKTLPMGTYVKVAHRENGREVVVRINDRGPFISGRIIDLSFAAANQLGLVGPGTGQVRIEAIGLKQKNSAMPGLSDAYVVQVGAFSSKENARLLAERLQQQLGDAVIHQEKIGGNLYYRVRTGRFTSLNEAENARNLLERQGYGNCFVVGE